MMLLVGPSTVCTRGRRKRDRRAESYSQYRGCQAAGGGTPLRAGDAEACGVQLPWDDPVAACRAVYLGNGEHHLSSMTIDVLRERPTEIDVLNGAVVEHGRRVGVATPVNEALWQAMKTIERTQQRRARLGPAVA
jgi:Ketopantoate reductase PanE/ApbA C terminal